jgi:hypothetical protein
MIPSYLRLRRHPAPFFSMLVSYVAFHIARRLLRGFFA